MGLTKTDLYSEEQLMVAELARAMAHPARVAIIQFLMTKSTCITGDIVNEIGLAQATISQHLRVLKDVGLIRGTIEGTSVCYCINPGRWNECQKVLSLFLSGSAEANDCC